MTAEGARQQAIATATTQAQHDAAHVTYFRAMVVSARANGLPHSVFLQALHELGATV